MRNLILSVATLAGLAVMGSAGAAQAAPVRLDAAIAVTPASALVHRVDYDEWRAREWRRHEREEAWRREEARRRWHRFHEWGEYRGG